MAETASAVQMSAEACPFCGNAELEGVRKTCHQCRTADRQRSVMQAYTPLLPWLKTCRAMVFSTERWISDNWFASTERSSFMGQNSVDVQAIDRADGAYDWVVCNHILEHVEDDSAALRELVRIVSDKGAVQITVPSPFRNLETSDWGYPKPELHDHYRGYGSDFADTARRAGVQNRLTVVIEDPFTPYRDYCYFFTKTKNAALFIGRELRRVDLPVILSTGD